MKGIIFKLAPRVPCHSRSLVRILVGRRGNHHTAMAGTVTNLPSIASLSSMRRSKVLLPLKPTRRMIHRIAGASTRDMADLEDRVHASIGKDIQDPIIGKSLQDLGWKNRRLAVSEDGTIQLLLKLPTLMHPLLDQLKEKVQAAAEAEIQQWAKEKGLEEAAATKVNVEAIAVTPVPFMVKDAEDQKEIETRLGPGLANVAHFLAVYSCKGGVGKSTIAVNLAYELARQGGRVGLLDLDVYGPSLPVLVKPDDDAVRQSQLGKGIVCPIEHKGLKMMSLGFVSPKSGVPGSGQNSGAAVLRGPMAGKVVTQLLKGTDWGDLDVLVLDLPPGTGDVQLTVCQDLDLSGAVGVTTPSKLAIADARKGIEMFSSLGVPTLAMVENMAYFECEGGGKHHPFGKGFKEFLDDDVSLGEMNKENVCQLPISEVANNANDSGTPLSLSRPDDANTELQAFSRLAQIVSKELLKLPHRPEQSNGQVSFEDSDDKFDLFSVKLSHEGEALVLRAFYENGAIQKRFSPSELRRREPKTGKVIKPSEDDTDDRSNKKMGMVEIHRSGSKEIDGKDAPDRIEKKAKVGFEVTWGDGAKFIYSRRAIALAAGGKLVS